MQNHKMELGYKKRFPFHRKDCSLPVKDLNLLTAVDQSVGLITIESLIDGDVNRQFATGFLVGSGYFMTVYHVVETMIDGIIQDIGRFMPDADKWNRWIQNNFSGEPHQSKEDAITAFIEKEKSISFQAFTNEMDAENCEKFKKRLKNKWDRCYVEFRKPNSSHQITKDITFHFDQCIPFADKESDTIILKVSTNSNDPLPNSLILEEKYEKRNKVSLYGYLKHEGKEELHLDIQCSVYTDASILENDIENAQRYWEDKESEIEMHNNTYAKVNFSEDFQTCSASFNEDHGRKTLHTSKIFAHGSPMVFIKRVGDARQPVVTAMYQRGLPSFYYELEESIRTGRPLPPKMTDYNKFRDLHVCTESKVKLNHFFESGVKMEYISNILKDSQKPHFLSLWSSIFGDRGPEEDVIDSEQPPLEMSKEQQEESNNETFVKETYMTVNPEDNRIVGKKADNIIDQAQPLLEMNEEQEESNTDTFLNENNSPSNQETENDYVTYLEDLPRLQFIEKRSKDYFEKVQQLDSRIWKAVAVPDLLRSRQMKIGFQRFSNDELVFTDPSESDMASRIRTQSRKKGYACGKDNFYNMLTLRSNSETVVAVETKLSLSQENKTRLIDFAAETLYKYVEVINADLKESIKTGQTHLKKLVLMGNSILERRKILADRSSRSTTVETILENLHKLQNRDVVGVGQAIDGIDVLVLEKEKTQSEKESLEKAILDFKTTKASETNIIWLPELPFQTYTKPGDKVIPKTSLQRFKKEGKGVGSIGVFARTDENRLVFTTAGHVIPNGNGEEVYVLHDQQKSKAICSSEVLIGRCLVHLGSGKNREADFAVIAVTEERVACNNFIFPPEEMPPICLYTGENGDLLGKTVQTIGADTDITEGIVKYDPYYFTECGIQRKRTYIMVEDMSSDEPFAQPGHSGAPVFRIEFPEETEKVMIISTILGGPLKRSEKNKLILSHRMDDALKEVEETTKIKINLDKSYEKN